VEDLAGGLKRDIEFTKEDLIRFGEQVKECESRVEGVRRGVEQKVRDVEKEVERAEQQQGNDSQHLRDELRSMKEAYVRRLDVIDERVNEARTEVSRRASEAVHRDQQIDQKVRSLEQQLLHSGAGTVAPSAFSLDGAVQASEEGIISTPVKGASSKGLASTAPLPGLGMSVGAGVGGDVGGGIIGFLQSEIAKLRERFPKEREEVDARVGEIEAAVREDRRRFVEENAVCSWNHAFAPPKASQHGQSRQGKQSQQKFHRGCAHLWGVH
jgi:hypothetical protein